MAILQQRQMRRTLQDAPQLRPFLLLNVTPTGRHLGEGSYGSVEEVEMDGLVCAGKKLYDTLMDPEDPGAQRMVDKYYRECSLLSELRHPHIVQFLGICFLPDSKLPVLVMELLQYSLDELLESKPDIALPTKLSVLQDVARGLVYLHNRSPAVIHRDLTARNVLLNSAMTAKIADLGNSRMVDIPPDQLAQTMTQGIPGTLVYMPPEVSDEEHKYGPSLDMFSFGHLSLFTAIQVFPKNLRKASYLDPRTNELKARSEIERRRRYIDMLHEKFAESKPALIVLIEGCLEYEPMKRLTARQAMERLGEMRVVGCDPHTNFNRLQLERVLTEKEAQLQQQATEIAAAGHRIRQLEIQLQQTEERSHEVVAVKDQEIAVQERALSKAEQRVKSLAKECEALKGRLEGCTEQILRMQTGESTSLGILPVKDTHIASLHIQLRGKERMVELHKAEQRWTPFKDRMRDATVDIYGKFQGFLNKLTPQKFQVLAEQALQLEINTEERLKGIVDKIFTKALEEPKYSLVYASLCKVLSPIKVEWFHNGKTEVTTFRRVLITKCQYEFEKEWRDNKQKNMLAHIGRAELAEKKQLTDHEELEVAKTKARKQSLNNIIFIGELFVLKMLSANPMHECIVYLLKSSSDEASLECFARLITITGKQLDLPETEVRIDCYFVQVKNIIRKGRISTRIKFLLQDVIKLRHNYWVPRGRQDQSLKTIDQIHTEAHAEEERMKYRVAQHQSKAVKCQTSVRAKPPPSTKARGPVLDEDTISRKAVTIIDELSENNDYKKAIECVKVMKVPSHMHVFVRELMNHTMEKTENSRIMASKLLTELLREKVLSRDRFKAGLSEVLEFAEDLEIDIPKIWDYMAQLLSHPVSEPTLIPLSVITSAMPEYLVENGKVGVLIAKVMNQLKGVCGTESTVVSLWKGSGLRWEELGVKGDDLENLITTEKIRFLAHVQPYSAVLFSPSASPLPKLMVHFQTSGTTNDDIMNWIERHCGTECRTPAFIRTLSTALLLAFVTGSGNTTSFDSEEFKRRSMVVLKKYVGDKQNLQLEILYACQITVAKLNHPPQLLHNLFHILYDLELVDEATFLEWRDRGKEGFGKGNAVHSLTDFYVCLGLVYPESDSDL